MKSTGIVRKVDELGRIVIPKELRRTLNIQIKDPVEIFMDEDKIVLKKFVSSNECTVCGNITEDYRVKGKVICSDCMEEITAVKA